MIDTLRTLAQPFSHWLMSHPNLTIVGLGLVVMWTAGQALLKGWHNERLHRDLAATRGDSRSVVRRTYTPAGAARAPEPESAAGLPPIRGGRTYARNLGNALQKAGMAPPVYSPPAPTGWGPGPTPQPGRIASHGPPAYAPPAPPWASPAQPMPLSGPNPMPAPAGAGPWPTYVPPSQPEPIPGQPAQPGLPFFAGPRGPLGPAISPPPVQAPGSYAVPAAPPTVPPASAPLAAPGWPLSEPVPPPLAGYAPPDSPVEAGIPPAPMQQAPVQPVSAKPKRRRFSLSVLQNLEKTLQRTAGLAPSSQVAEPPVPAPTTAPSVVPAPPPAAKSPSRPELLLTPPEFEPGAPSEAADETASATGEVEEMPAPVAEAEANPALAAQAEDSAAPPPDVTGSTDAESTAWEPEPPVSDTRAAMRAMLFGEDEKPATRAGPEKPPGIVEPEPEAEEPVFRFEPVVAEPALSDDRATSTEETVQPVEPAAESVEVPVEAPVEPVGSHWGLEASDLPSAVAPDQAEPDVTAPAFDAAMSEPATGETHGAAPDFAEAAAGGDRGNLVIIEDDPSVAEYYATLFRGNGYNVHVASDGIAGVDLCTRLQPQVIMLDVMMPRQNGMLVLQTLRASDETKDTPVVVLSNFSEPTLVKRALQLGALEYVIKTQVEGAALLEAMPRWMNREKAFAAA